MLCWGESCDADKLSLLSSSQCGYVWIRREGSPTTTAFLSTVNKLSLRAPFRLPPSLELRTEDEQRGDGLTWRTDVSVCFAAKLYNLCRLPLFCITGARCRQRRQVLKLCCKFMSWTHNKWMSLDPAWLYFLKKHKTIFLTISKHHEKTKSTSSIYVLFVYLKPDASSSSTPQSSLEEAEKLWKTHECSFPWTHTVVYFEIVPHKLSCCPKYSLEHQMCINPQKIIPNTIYHDLVMFAINYDQVI